MNAGDVCRAVLVTYEVLTVCVCEHCCGLKLAAHINSAVPLTTAKSDVLSVHFLISRIDLGFCLEDAGGTLVTSYHTARCHKQ